MGAYLSRGTEAGSDVPTSKVESTVVIADVQKVTFADPPASIAKSSPQPAAAGPLESVLKREGTARKSRTARAATFIPAPASVERPKRATRTPRPAAPIAAMIPAVVAADAAVAAPAAVAAAAHRTAKRAAKKAAAHKKAPVAALAAPAPELVVVGKAMRQKGAVPARKVGMKRMAKRALKPVAAPATSRPSRSKK